MNCKEMIDYEPPVVEVIEVEVKKGFAPSMETPREGETTDW